MCDPVGEDFELRTIRADQVPELLDFWSISAENTNRPVDHTDGVLRLLEHDPEALVVAVADAEIVGSLISGWDGCRLHLYRLAVRPDWRRRGIAGALVGHAEKRCAALGGARVDAMVLTHNDVGTQFWPAAGYRVQPEWSRWVRSL